jgi:hypothetical protein
VQLQRNADRHEGVALDAGPVASFARTRFALGTDKARRREDGSLPKGDETRRPSIGDEHAHNRATVLTARPSVGRLAAGDVAPAQAASGQRQINGTASFQTSPSGPCAWVPEEPHEEFKSYPPLVMDGDLKGCWYTLVLSSKKTPSGVYLETGQEYFVGTLDGQPGTFITTYRFEAKFASDGVTELRGRCQHPLVAGSGTVVFSGATGRLNFKDIIGDPVTYVYRGHIHIR